MTDPAPDPLVSLPHRTDCAQLHEHVPPIGFDLDEPKWTGEHGESFLVSELYAQCMCGHPDYLTCPDYLSPWELSRSCKYYRHTECRGVGGVDLVSYAFDRNATPGPDTCPCACHSIRLSQALANTPEAAQ